MSPLPPVIIELEDSQTLLFQRSRKPLSAFWTLVFFFFLYIHIRLDGDDQQLLVTLFKTEEKDRIQLESRKLALERDSGTLPDAEAWGEQTFPSS